MICDPAAETMPRTYTVQDGDSMGLIAHKLGFRDWRVLYRHPDNAAFRGACPDPNLLVAGTQLVVPDTPRPKRHSRRTGAEHTFVLGRSADVLRLRLTSPKGDAIAGWLYRLRLDQEEVRGTAPDNGELEMRIPNPVAVATLAVWPTDAPEPDDDDAIELHIGGLAPVADGRGLQSRLANLGLYHGEVDGDVGSGETVSALRALERSGVVDLVAKYGC